MWNGLHDPWQALVNRVMNFVTPFMHILTYTISTNRCTQENTINTDKKNNS